MSNTATTALMIPIAVSLANNLGADPRAVVIATVIAGSCAYATPIGMPANTMVVGLGGYKFKDYVKSGLPLILVSFVICMILLPVLFPFYPCEDKPYETEDFPLNVNVSIEIKQKTCCFR